MDNKLDCDFYWGDWVPAPIKQFSCNELRGFKKTLTTKRLLNTRFHYYKGIGEIFNRKYTHYILSGEIYYITNWIILLYAKITKRKVFIWTHGQNRMITRFIGRLFFGGFYAFADGVFMYGKENCKYMMSFGCKKERLHIIHNSLDTNKQTILYNRAKTSNIYSSHFNNNNPTIIFIGRVLEARRLDLLVEALKQLKEDGICINCAIVGPVIQGDKLINSIKEANLDSSFWFYGACYEEEKNAELLYNASACVSPSYIGLTAIHSLSFGTPVIANNNAKSNGPELESIQHHINGSLFEENNIDSLKNEIKYWTSISIEERNNIRKKARDIIQKEWSVDYQISIIKKTIRIQ